jgi:hypothetical protein
MYEMDIFDNIKKGDKVYSVIDGWGIVKNIDKQGNNIPIEVSFREGGLRNDRYFRFDGRNSNLDKHPTLFLEEVSVVKKITLWFNPKENKIWKNKFKQK